MVDVGILCRVLELLVDPGRRTSFFGEGVGDSVLDEHALQGRD